MELFGRCLNNLARRDAAALARRVSITKFAESKNLNSEIRPAGRAAKNATAAQKRAHEDGKRCEVAILRACDGCLGVIIVRPHIIHAEPSACRSPPKRYDMTPVSRFCKCLL